MAATAELRLQTKQFRTAYAEAAQTARMQNDRMRADTKSLSTAIKTGLTGAVGALGGISVVTQVGAMFKEAADEAQQLRNIADAANEPVEAMARVQYATKALGLDFEAASEVSRELEDRLGDLGNSEPIEVLNRLGLDSQKLIAMPIDEKILTLSDAFKKGRVDGVAYSDLVKLVGDSAAENLTPMLVKSREEIENLFAEVPNGIGKSIDELADAAQVMDELGAQASNWFTMRSAAVVKDFTLIKDLLQTGSWEQAMSRGIDREADRTLKRHEEQEAAKAKADAIAAAREEEKAAVAREAARKAEEEAAKKIADLQKSMADADFSMLPDDEKIAALKRKLDTMLEDTVGLFSLNFETSIEGLEALIKARQEKGDALPATGQNSVLEAVEWLKQARELQQQRVALEKAATDREKAAAEQSANELAAAREKAEEGEFRLLSPEEQAKALRDKLSKSLGFDISGMADVEKGLSEARRLVEEARESGDVEAEKAALAKLNEAQTAAKNLAAVSSGGNDRESAVVNGRGTVAGAIANIFGRSSADLELDEAKVQTGLLTRIQSVLEDIKQQDQPDPFSDPPLTYP